jgi:flagellar biosynthesis GTPase FlhF
VAGHDERRKEREEWLNVLKRHVRVVMMKKFNFPFEEAAAAAKEGLAESSVDLDGRYLTTTNGEKALLCESSGKIKRARRKHQHNKGKDLSFSSGDVQTAIDKIVKKKEKKEKRKNEERHGATSKAEENEEEEEEKNSEASVDAFTIAVLGGGGVGKSSLITRFLVDDFYGEDTADPTLQDEYSGRIVIDNRACTPSPLHLFFIVCVY